MTKISHVRQFGAIALIALLAACGVSGPLEKAAPLFGPDRVAYEAERAKQEALAKQKAEQRAARDAANKQDAAAAKNADPKN